MPPKPAARPTFSLPTTKTVPAEKMSAYSVLIYGREKAGKTTLVAQFPDVIFLSTEPGTKNLSVYAVAPKSWLEFVAYVDLLEKEKRFSNVCVDTIDLAFDMCEAYVCAKLGVNHASEGDFGSVWSAIRKEFSKQIARLQAMPRGLVLLSHAQHKEIKSRGNQSRDRVEPTMSGQARRVVEPMVDIWGYYEYGEGNTRRLYIQGADEFNAGNRLENRFLVKGTTRQHEWLPMGSSAKEAYDNFMKAFSNDLAGPKAAAASTPQGAGRVVARRSS